MPRWWMAWVGLAMGIIACQDVEAAQKRVRGAEFAKRPEVSSFIDEMAREHRFDPAQLRRLFTQVRREPRSIEAMDRPLLAPPPWHAYRPQFVSAERVAYGLRYWSRNAAALERARASFGVPPEIIVAIVGVETFYGRNTGRFRVVDALATLAFDYPRRANFFRHELAEFLLLAREQRISPLVPEGSYAGAMGLPQFMPSSFRSYALDFDGDKRIDLWRDGADVIGSVANFLRSHGWAPGGLALVEAQVLDQALLASVSDEPRARRTLSDWEQLGVKPGQPYPGDEDPLAVLVRLEENDGTSFRLGFRNFETLLRYNRSPLYACAVWDLAERLRAARQPTP